MKKVLVLALSLLLGGAAAQAQTTPAAATQAAGPQIQFAEMKYDFGVIKPGDVVDHTFTFKNTGTAPLIISNIQASCGCTTPEWTREPVMPGKTGTRILFDAEDEIESGDYLMVVRNNYFWLPKDSEIGFLANGDFVQVVKIIRRTEEFGFRFADARVRLVDYPDEPDLEVKLLLDTLHTESPALPADRSKALYDAVGEDYADLPTKKDRSAALRKDPFLNALQVKFAYALTCHKAQGGQWQAVFVDHGFLKDDMVNSEFARWLYTAITRAAERLFLLNFNQKLLAE